MPVMRQRAQRAALIASLSAWPLLALPLPTHAFTLPGTAHVQLEHERPDGRVELASSAPQQRSQP